MRARTRQGASSPERKRIHPQDAVGGALVQVRDAIGACAQRDVKRQEVFFGRVVVGGFRGARAVVQEVVDAAFPEGGGHPVGEATDPVLFGGVEGFLHTPIIGKYLLPKTIAHPTAPDRE